MTLSYPEYVRLVMNSYWKRKQEGTLSLQLSNSTAARLREACINRYKQPLGKKDRLILEDFFGPEEPRRSMAVIIEQSNRDQFKPLDNYLKGKTEATDSANLNLLAWLIDVEPRPWELGIKPKNDATERTSIPVGSSFEPFLSKSIENGIIANDSTEEGNRLTKSNDKSNSSNPEPTATDEMISDPSLKTFATGKKTRIAAAGVLGLSIVYMLWNKINPDQRCMVWVDTAYQTVSCQANVGDRLMLPRNDEVIKNLKKITRPDTISERSVGRIYYIKTNNQLEFFTSGGRYPENIDRNLNPLTQYMFNKYLKQPSLSLKSK